MAKKNSAVLWTVGQSLEKGDKEQARHNMGISFESSTTLTTKTLTFVDDIKENATTGDLTFTKNNVLVDGSINSSSNNPISNSAVSTALNNLKTFYATTSNTFNELLTAYNNGQTLMFLADKDVSDKNHVYTLNWISKSGSTIDAFEFVSIDKWVTSVSPSPAPTKTESLAVDAWVCHKTTTPQWEQKFNWQKLATTEYADFNVSPTFQSADVAIATGDKLLISDSSDDGKEARSGIAFDTTASETSFLNQRGEWNTALHTEFNRAESTDDVHWNDFTGPGFYSILNSPNPATDATSPEQNDMFALVGNSNTVGGTYKAQLALGDSLYYRHTTGANNVSWTDWRTVLTIGDQNIGQAPPSGYNYQPVYIKDGEVTACPILFPELSSENGDGITFRYDTSNNWYCIGTKSYVAYNKYVKTTGTDPNIVPEHFEFDKASSLVFGDGFAYGITSAADYWGLHLATHSTGETRSPLVIEAPSVTYAYTSLSNAGFEKGQAGETRLEIEFWNEHRLRDYATCSQYRTGTASSTSYISQVSFSTLDGTSGVDICLIPPHHWGFINGCITGESQCPVSFPNMTVSLYNNFNYIAIDNATYNVNKFELDSITQDLVITLVSETVTKTTLTVDYTIEPESTSHERPSGVNINDFVIKFKTDNTTPNGKYDISYVLQNKIKYSGRINFTFALLSTQHNQTYKSVGSIECVGVAYGDWGDSDGVSINLSHSTMKPCTFGFFCYNPTNENKYISCCVPSTMPEAVYTINKQLLIVKTPELGAFNWPYVAPPATREIPIESESD